MSEIGDKQLDRYGNGVLRCSVPYGYSHVRQISLYAVESEGQALLVDTGDASSSGPGSLLESLGLSNRMDTVKVFITHAHCDHVGHAHELEERGAHVYMHGAPPHPANMSAGSFSRLCGYNDDDDTAGSGNVTTLDGLQGRGVDVDAFERLIVLLPPHVPQDLKYQKTGAGDVLEIGERSLKAIATPGHSPDHMCLFDKDEGALFSGDAVVNGFLSIVASTSLGEHSMRDCLESLDAMERLDACALFPGHLDPVFGEKNIRACIQNTRSNYLRDIDCTLEILSRRKEATVSEMAKAYCRHYAGGYDSKEVPMRGVHDAKMLSQLEYLADIHEATCVVDSKGTARFMTD